MVEEEDRYVCTPVRGQAGMVHAWLKLLENESELQIWLTHLDNNINTSFNQIQATYPLDHHNFASLKYIHFKGYFNLSAIKAHLFLRHHK